MVVGCRCQRRDVHPRIRRQDLSTENLPDRAGVREGARVYQTSAQSKSCGTRVDCLRSDESRAHTTGPKASAATARVTSSARRGSMLAVGKMVERDSVDLK